MICNMQFRREDLGHSRGHHTIAWQVLIHVQQVWLRRHWQQSAEKSFTTLLTAPTWFTVIFICLGQWSFALGGQKLQTDGELKVFDWLRSQDKTLYAVGVVNFPGEWKMKYVVAMRECLEKEWEFDDSGMYVLFVNIEAQVNIEPLS